ncbi:branched-chain amino acid ABC transporter permease [Rubrivivax gelatinosus]|uniref:Branched-chain amino acid ABC transporter permease n=1 Tax=Rubrivivax gelatinosus TaxID=28068 RepID=A0ABS1DVP7_RUBGE|nr:AzlC family ABC transporter permease [Rubrivivax gelatinosus]MBK1612926.1 branched-chain amino acid ABC transporter permease [Rubrivivax gelatinosus]MBK1713573.1 branched-chain amino acid ABC transporter permease [Rubrivivax gelatinosus]
MFGWRHPEFRRGAREMAGILPGIGAWGMITGVAMIKAGLSVPLAVLMTLLVYAGSAQLAALPLMAAGAPIWVVWATAFCVNLRFVIFSAQWRPYFAAYPRAERARMAFFSGDLNYILFMRRFPDPVPAPEQKPYFWGGAVSNWFAWQVPSMVGIALADVIPTSWGIGFAGTLALIGLACSLLGSRSSLIAAVVAGCAAVAAYALPLRLNIVVAIAAAVAIGVMLDRPGSRPGPATPVGGSR